MVHVILYLVITLCVTMDIAWCSPLVFPQNTAVFAGQMMSMDCRTQNGSVVREWSLIRARVSLDDNPKQPQRLNEDKIFSNWKSGTKSTRLAQFSMDADQYGSGTLYSNATRLEDAGLYTCAVEIGQELTRWSAHLIVFESTPVCETNLSAMTNKSLMEGDRIWMRCSVRFRGHWTPSMEWRQHGEDQDEKGRIVVADKVAEKESFNVTSTIRIVIKSSTNNSFFSCKTYFETQTHRRRANATNAPDFSYLWKSHEIKHTDLGSAAVDSTPMTTTSLVPGFISSANMYFVLLTAVGTLAAFSGVVTTILCIRMKRSSLASDPVTTPAKEVDRPISTVGQTVVSRSSIFYDSIDDEIVIPTQTVQDTTTLSALHPGSRASFAGDTFSSCTIHRISAFERRYVNADICTTRSNHQTHAALPVPNPDLESPTPGTNNCPANQDGDTKQSYSECKDAPYTRVIAQVGRTDTYQPLQTSSARDPNFDNNDAAA